MNMLEFKCEQLEKEVLMLKQELEFRNMETAEYRDRQAQLKRMNESLARALEQQKPNNSHLTEVKLMVEQYGGGEKEKALEAELDRIKRGIENEIAERVRAIVLETEIKFKACTRCRDLDGKISEMDLQLSRLRSRTTTQTDYATEIQAKYREAMDQLQLKQTKLLDTEMEFRRFREESQRDLQRKRSDEDVNSRISELEMKDLMSGLERKKQEELNEYKRKLEINFESTLKDNIQKIKKQFHEQYEEERIELERKLRQQRESVQRKQEDLKRKTSRMTPIKTLGLNQQTQIYQHTQQFNIFKTEGVRTGVSPSWRKENTKNYNSNANTMEGQIKSIISGMARNRQQDFRGGESQVSHGTGRTGAYYQDDEGSEYSNFSIKEAIVRPNNLMENHYKLKNNRFY